MNLNSVISVGVLASSVGEVAAVEALHAGLSAQYKYYEILVIANPSDELVVTEDALLCLSNTRLVVMSDNAPDAILRKKFFELAIGDVVVLFDPTESEVSVIDPLVDAALDGYDFAGNEYVDDSFSVSDQLNRIFCSLLSSLSGCNVNSRLSYTGAYSRALVNAINNAETGQDDLRLLLATAGFSSTTLRKGIRRRRSVSAILRRLGGALDIIGSVPHRLLLLTAWLSLGAFMANMLYFFYVIGAWLVVPQVQPGWTTTGLTQSFLFGILFLVLFVFSCVFSFQIGKKTQNRYTIARDVSRSECITSFDHLNVTDKQ